MSERHITDEEVWEASGTAPRQPNAVPQAVCIACGEQYHAFYACFAHDCMIDLKQEQTYAEWLRYFHEELAMGVLKSVSSAKFGWDEMLTGRTFLTEWLQTDIIAQHGLELKTNYYFTPRWQAAGFPA